MMLSLAGYYLMSLAKESVKAEIETGLFYITHKRLNNIIWGSL